MNKLILGSWTIHFNNTIDALIDDWMGRKPKLNQIWGARWLFLMKQGIGWDILNILNKMENNEDQI